MNNPQSRAANGLAMALLAGEWQALPMRHRCRDALGRSRAPTWLTALVAEVLELYRDAPVDRPRELAAVVQRLPAWERAWKTANPPRVTHWEPVPTAMGRQRWPITAVPDSGALARLLDLDAGELLWFADNLRLERGSAEALRHYRWHTLPKRGGVRLVAAPKPRLKEIQRRVLRHLLRPIPVHDAAHGGVAGRSVRTALLPHADAQVVIRVDLESFFPSISAPRIFGLFRSAGLPEPVAYDLTGLCTTVVPHAVWRAVPVPARGDAHWRLGASLAVPHVPQGAPTSPALANLIAFSLDRRLAALAAGFGASYTRYVDDLTFSGGTRLRNGRSAFVARVEQVVAAEGFRVAEHKTVVLGRAGRQQLLGAVVNHHPALPRAQRDNLRAVLHNCRVRGWRSQARGDEQFARRLLGKVSAVSALDPVFGARLRVAYDTVDWR